MSSADEMISKNFSTCESMSKQQSTISEITETVSSYSICSKNMSHRRLIETEFVRQRLYNEILESIRLWLSRYQDYYQWSTKQISHLLLRYIFIKKAILSRPTSDPVFIIGRCSLARQQVVRDFEHNNMSNIDELIDLIDHQLVIAALELCVVNIEVDAPVRLSKNGELNYKGRIQQDFSRLAERFGPDHYHAAYALGLRYKYMCLWNHGLAREYENETKLSPSYPFACECFASTFNHYLDRYYSAFPDLEVFFGSRGCFFKAKWEKEPAGMTYYVCPPFDETLMHMCVERVLDVLRDNVVSRAYFIFTLPGSWTDFKALEKLKESPWTVRIIDYPIGQLRFIDYMAEKDSRIRYPTDICEVILTNCDA